jgi:hypothetical protein
MVSKWVLEAQFFFGDRKILYTFLVSHACYISCHSLSAPSACVVSFHVIDQVSYPRNAHLRLSDILFVGCEVLTAVTTKRVMFSAVTSSGRSPTFRRNVLLPSSWSKSKRRQEPACSASPCRLLIVDYLFVYSSPWRRRQYIPTKCMYAFTRLHCVTVRTGNARHLFSLLQGNSHLEVQYYRN